jgi:hypothetical protein
MNLHAFLAPVLALLGLLAFVLSSNAKVAELGKLTFFAGLLVFLLRFTTGSF